MFTYGRNFVSNRALSKASHAPVSEGFLYRDQPGTFASKFGTAAVRQRADRHCSQDQLMELVELAEMPPEYMGWA
jgi:hypothetical protein